MVIIYTFYLLLHSPFNLHCWMSRTRRVSASVLDNRLIYHFYISVSFHDTKSTRAFILFYHGYIKHKLVQNVTWQQLMFLKLSSINETKRSIFITERITLFNGCGSWIPVAHSRVATAMSNLQVRHKIARKRVFWSFL